ncbi:alpha-L-glutamate ligase [Candidatus Acetothermia bacterium]|nr:alpha-L-glutamate ligase [Candidatus Acetothermia bacterium]MBI3643309.1 alpha-L-glutamate ligase [Candidatus Acetothermia bacterium]
MNFKEPKIYILYENDAWLPPLIRELERARLPYEKWLIHTGSFDLSEVPPIGIFLNRMSPSSHTRDHRESVDFTRELLVWLESHGRRVINGSRAFSLEISKVRQYECLRRFEIQTPHTIVASGTGKSLKDAAKKIETPFITKHNRGGKGLGVRLFRSHHEFEEYADSPEFEYPIDNITLLQEYIEAPEPYITRVEIVAGQFLYAIRSETSRGFLLCPADGCAPEESLQIDPQSLFSLREDFDDPIVAQYIQFMEANGLDLAGIEFIEDRNGRKVTYDVNGTTNYSPAVEERNGLNGMAALAGLLKRALNALERDRVSIRA